MSTHLVFETKWGWMAVATSRRGVTAILLPVKSRHTAEAEARKWVKNRLRKGFEEEADGRLLEIAQHQLADFLYGHRRNVDLPLDLCSGSPFQRRVWRATQRIPYGRVRSYRWIAERVGGRQYARAVGLALGANPVPIAVPCHRIVASHGGLGGFTGGVRAKRRLLALEGSLSQLTI